MIREEENKIIKCLDHGFVRLVDVMGDDASICQAARVSYGPGTKSVSEDRGLIRYLVRHEHQTPFEMCVFRLHVKAPIFVIRQWHRHRTWSYNEQSGRYSVLPEEFYVPEPEQVTTQSALNKQGGSEEVMAGEEQERINFMLEGQAAFQAYGERLANDMRRELARINLPLSTYTEMYAQVNLRNLFGFLLLRLDSHAQYEIRVYAEAISEFVKARCPLAWEAFEDYQLHAVRFSRQEISLIADILTGSRVAMGEVADRIPNKREREEFFTKLERLGVLVD